MDITNDIYDLESFIFILLFKQDLLKYDKPDVVFIGGHGGRLSELLQQLNQILLSDAIVVINAVQESSINAFKESCKSLNWKLEEELNIALDLHNPICLLKAIKI